jgi:ectoine hydroxylase-related dioxygenase (phytanoyl-CoA dioxygenase family)
MKGNSGGLKESFMAAGRYDEQQIESWTQSALRDGFCLLRDHFSRETLEAWREAFTPLLETHIAREGHLFNRGPARYYVTLPFTAPFADPSIFEDEDVLAIVRGLVGEDAVMPQLATDTPLIGSDYQDIHRDTPPLFPETGQETPPYQLAVNFPLVDMSIENGPFEVARGTHMMSKAEGLSRIESGEIRLEPIIMRLGDVMIRDVRGLHRGTPNRTRVPRPMVVIGYSRRWLYRPEVSIRVPRAALATLSERARRLLRFNPVVDSPDDLPETEIYQSFAY